MKIARQLLLSFLLFMQGHTQAQLKKVFALPFPAQYKALDSLVVLRKMGDTAYYDQHFIDELLQAARQTKNPLSILNSKRAVLTFRNICAGKYAPAAFYHSLLQDYLELLEENDEHKYPEMQAIICVNIGNIYYYQLKQYAEAFEYYLRAYDSYKHVPVERYPDRHYAQYAIARAYYDFQDYATTIRLCKEIEQLYPEKNYVSVYTFDMMGMSYLKTQQYDSALVLFQWIVQHPETAHPVNAWKAIAMGNIGLVYYYQGNLNQALEFLRPAIEISRDENIPDNTAAFAAKAIAIYVKQNNVQQAGKYAEQALIAAHQANTVINYFDVYQALAGYYKQTGDLAKAITCMDSANLFKDSLAVINNVNLKNQGERMVETIRKKQMEKMIQEEKSRQVLMRNGLVVLIILLMLIALLVYSRMRLMNKNREQQLLAEKWMAEKELNNATSKLADFTRSIIEKNELLEKTSTEIDELQEAYQRLKDEHGAGMEPAAKAGLMKVLQEAVLLTNEQWRDFAVLFEKVHPGFFSRLKEKLPGLSPAETRFAALSKLKLNNKEMAAMLAVGTDAIRQSRSRFRKKFNLSEDASVEDAIDLI